MKERSVNAAFHALSAWWAAARANRLFALGLGGAVLVIALDQLTKYWIVNIVRMPERGMIELSGIFDLSYVQNYGASFGLLAGVPGGRIILTLIPLGVALGLGVWLGRLGRNVPAAGSALIIGGALGNLYDRLAYGYVVDFLDFSGLGFPWVFNIADVAINVGVGLLLLDMWLTRERPRDEGR